MSRELTPEAMAAMDRQQRSENAAACYGEPIGDRDWLSKPYTPIARPVASLPGEKPIREQQLEYDVAALRSENELLRTALRTILTVADCNLRLAE